MLSLFPSGPMLSLFRSTIELLNLRVVFEEAPVALHLLVTGI
jgi:hypothetical protein